ncbi:hypothetical protein [Desulfobulbus propionicus]|nr:hypothetical protein [Desulfobulbus propionicus]
MLHKIVDMYSRLHPIGNKAARDMALQPVKSELRYLRQRVALDRSDMFQYIDELESSFSGALATRPTLGHSPQQHQLRANNAVRVLERNLGKFDYSG